MVTAISDLEKFKLIDKNTEKYHYGCNQEWYTTDIQRRAGCGPTVASNIILYMYKDIKDTDSCLKLMEEIWEYVTPSNRGVNKTGMFYGPLSEYINLKGFNAKYHYLDIQEDKSERPSYIEVKEFVLGALKADDPVAFLNLDNGKEKNLDRWHWVTLVSIDDNDDIEIIDESVIKRVNLKGWYDTTTLGGGFVYLEKISN